MYLHVQEFVIASLLLEREVFRECLKAASGQEEINRQTLLPPCGRNVKTFR